MKTFSSSLLACVIAGSVIFGQGRGNQEPGPTVTVRGHTFTQRDLFQRNVGGPDDQTARFPPHKVIGNIYYVGTKSLSAFLIVTPQGHILLDSTNERNVPTIEKSVSDLGFKFSDVKILLGNHAHGDHQEGDALVKQKTGAQVVAMAEDVPPLQAIAPGGKAHPIDRIIHDGDSVTLGGTTLIAHLTAGHTPGCTTWTMRAQEGGRTYDVVFHCSYRAGALTPATIEQFNRTFKLVRSLPCDVPLGDHPAQYNMHEKHAKPPPTARGAVGAPGLQSGGPNPFIDAANCNVETDIMEAMFRASLDEQQQARPAR